MSENNDNNTNGTNGSAWLVLLAWFQFLLFFKWLTWFKKSKKSIPLSKTLVKRKLKECGLVIGYFSTAFGTIVAYLFTQDTKSFDLLNIETWHHFSELSWQFRIAFLFAPFTLIADVYFITRLNYWKSIENITALEDELNQTNETTRTITRLQKAEEKDIAITQLANTLLESASILNSLNNVSYKSLKLKQQKLKREQTNLRLKERKLKQKLKQSKAAE